MASINYYVLLNKNGNMITTDSKLPIYLSKECADRDFGKFAAHEVRPIKIDVLRRVIKDSGRKKKVAFVEIQKKTKTKFNRFKIT